MALGDVVEALLIEKTGRTRLEHDARSEELKYLRGGSGLVHDLWGQATGRTDMTVIPSATGVESISVPLRRALAVGVAVAVFGIGALYVLSQIIEVRAGATGFADSRAGTIGDAILPFIVGWLVYSRARLDTDPRFQPVSLLAGLCGASVGAFSQYVWLSDPDFGPDWMLSAPHQFSAAGWYHAFFLVVVAGGLTALAVDFVLAGRRVTGLGTATSGRLPGPLSIAGVLTAVTVFEMTALVDSARGGGSSVSSMSAIPFALAPPALFLLVLCASVHAARRTVLLALPQIAVASSIAWLLMPEDLAAQPGRLVATAAILCIAASSSFVMFEQTRVRANLILPAVICLPTALSGHGSHFIIWANVLLAAVLLVYPRAPVSEERVASLVRWLKVGVVALSIQCSALAAGFVGGGGESWEALATAAVAAGSLVLTWAFLPRYWRQMNAIEVRSLSGDLDRAALMRATLRVWAPGVIYVVAVFLATIPVLLYTAGKFDFALTATVAGSPRPISTYTAPILIAILAVLFISLTLAAPSERSRRNWLRSVGRLGSLMLALAIVVAVAVVVPSPRLDALGVFALVFSTAYGVHAWVSVRGDCALALGAKPTPARRWLHLSSSLAAGLVAWLMLSEALTRPSFTESMLMASVAFILANAVSTVATASVLAGVEHDEGVWPAWWTLLQDDLVRWFAGLVGGWLSLALVVARVNGTVSTVVALLVFVGASLAVYVPVTFGLQGWQRHAAEVRAVKFDGVYREGWEPDMAGFIGCVRAAWRLLAAARRNPGSAGPDGEWMGEFSQHIGRMILATVAVLGPVALVAIVLDRFKIASDVENVTEQHQATNANSS